MNDSNPQFAAPNRSKLWAFRFLIAAITFAAFTSGLSGEFVNWDDDANIVFNEGIRGLEGEHLNWMFTTFHGGHYQPLAWLSFAIDYSVWGLNPFGFHLTNLILHCLVAVIFFDVALMLLSRGFQSTESAERNSLSRAALIATLLFSIHPLRVESVTWITERRDVLSGVFVMVSVFGYLKFAFTDRGTAWLIVSWASFALAMLTKASAVPLPAVFLIFDVFPLQRIHASVRSVLSRIGEKIPYMICSVVASVLAIKAQAAAEAWQTIERFDLASRVATVTYGLCWYPLKFFVPTKLCALYPIPGRTQLVGSTFALTTAIVVIGCITIVALRRRLPALLVATISYALLLGPVSGIAQSGEQFVADRYGYLPLIPLAILLAAALHFVVQHAKTNPARASFAKLLRVSMGAYLFGLFFLTVFQTTVWSNSQSLWTHALTIGVESHIAHVNVAETLRETGHDLEAYKHYEHAAKLDRSDAKAHNGMGITALKLVRPELALKHLSKAVELAPTHAKYRFNIAEVFAGFDELPEAVRHLQVAVESAPCFIDAIERLASMQDSTKQFAAARTTLENGLQCTSNSSELLGHLAWLLATCPDETLREGDRAIELARQLCEQTEYNDAMALSTLAVAYAETMDFERAGDLQSTAIRLASEQGITDSIAELRRRHALFADDQKYRPLLAETNHQP